MSDMSVDGPVEPERHESDSDALVSSGGPPPPGEVNLDDTGTLSLEEPADDDDDA